MHFLVKHPRIAGLIFCCVVSVLMNMEFLADTSPNRIVKEVDIYFTAFTVNHWMSVFTHPSKWISPQTWLSEPMYFGMKNTVLFSEHFLGASGLLLPLYILTGSVTSSLQYLFVVGIALSGWSMFVYMHYLTKRFWPSAVAAIVFIFSPAIQSHFPYHINLVLLPWIPLTFYFAEKIVEKPRPIYYFLFFFFIIIEWLTSFYYAHYLTVFALLYVVIRLLREKKSLRSCINVGSAMGVGLLLCIMGIMIAQYFSVFPSRILLPGSGDIEPMFYPLVSDYLIPSERSVLWGSIRGALAGRFAEFVRIEPLREHRLFWGIIPTILFLSGFFIHRRGLGRRIWIIWLTGLCIAVVFSFGPFVQVSQQLRFPNITLLLERFTPYYYFFRVPSRVAIFTVFFLALIVGQTWESLTFRFSQKKQWGYGIIVVFLLCLEFIQYPPESIGMTQTQLDFFASLDRDKQISLIIDLPIANFYPYLSAKTRSLDADSIYLWYALYHKKFLVNGRSDSIIQEYLINNSKYTENFPTPHKLIAMKNEGIEGIVLHKEEFKDVREFDEIRQGLLSLGIPEPLHDGSLSLFKLAQWQPSL